MQLPSKLSYVSFLQYSPRGTSSASVSSRVFRDAIKNDKHVHFTKDGKTTSVRGIEVIVDSIKREMDNFSFLGKCLGPGFTLVPIPRSAPLSDKGALWPTYRICEALVSAGLGAEVAPILKRKTAVQKASTAPKGMRPNPEQHYESTIIDNDAPALMERPITLVDDIVTQGASFVGMFARIAEAFPRRDILCFAVMQTIMEGDVQVLKSPVRGTITRYPSGKLWRDGGSANQPSLF